MGYSDLRDVSRTDTAERHGRIQARRKARAGFRAAEIAPWCGEPGGSGPTRDQHTDCLVAGLRGLLYSFEALDPISRLCLDDYTDAMFINPLHP